MEHVHTFVGTDAHEQRQTYTHGPTLARHSLASIGGRFRQRLRQHEWELDSEEVGEA